MGNGRWDTKNWTAYSTSVKDKPLDTVYASRSVQRELAVENIKVRESCDSPSNPNSTPMIVGLDVTGSMGFIADFMAKEGLGGVVGNVLQHKPIPDPHILFLGIGDAVAHDPSPLQATQFEADTRIIEQLTKIWLVKQGGGNDFESYDLAWAFAAWRTKCDAWLKRKVKGYLFTVGDECFPQATNAEYLRSIFQGETPQRPTPEALYKEACEKWHVFHVIVAEGSFARQALPAVEKSWQKHLGRRALTLLNHKHIAELITSAIAVSEGKDIEEAVSLWKGEAKKSVQHALLGGSQ